QLANDRSRETTTQFAYCAILISLVVVTIADYYTPRGVAVWVVHIVPVAISLLAWRPVLPLIVAAIATVSMSITFMTDDAGVDFGAALLNRIFGVITVWVIAGVAYFFIKSKSAIDFQRWLQQGQSRLSKAMSGDQQPEQLGDNI